MASFQKLQFALLFFIYCSSLGLAKSILPRQANTTQVDVTFMLVAIHSGTVVEGVHLQPLIANNKTFWLGKDTKTYCPPEIADCPAGIETQFRTRAGESAIELYSDRGRQLLYVSSNGALGFLPGDSIFHLPTGGRFGLFNVTVPADPNRLGEAYYIGGGAVARDRGFYACPLVKGINIYQVFVPIEGWSDEDVPGGCLEECIQFAAAVARVEDAGPAAWEYV